MNFNWYNMMTNILSPLKEKRVRSCEQGFEPYGSFNDKLHISFSRVICPFASCNFVIYLTTLSESQILLGEVAERSINTKLYRVRKQVTVH
jgi:hypothetical protein